MSEGISCYLTAENRWKGGKTPHKFTYTYQDIADLTGLTLSTVRKYARCNSRGLYSKFNPESLESVVNFIGTYLSAKCLV